MYRQLLLVILFSLSGVSLYSQMDSLTYATYQKEKERKLDSLLMEEFNGRSKASMKDSIAAKEIDSKFLELFSAKNYRVIKWDSSYVERHPLTDSLVTGKSSLIRYYNSKTNQLEYSYTEAFYAGFLCKYEVFILDNDVRKFIFFTKFESDQTPTTDIDLYYTDDQIVYYRERFNQQGMILPILYLKLAYSMLGEIESIPKLR